MCAPLGAFRTSPAALQIASQIPWNRSPCCCSGNQAKPAMAATIAIAAVIPTLAVNHGLRRDAILSPLITALRR